MFQRGWGENLQKGSLEIHAVKDISQITANHKKQISQVSDFTVQIVKNLPAMRETCVQSLGWEDPLEKSMATHSSILACRIPMDRGA